MEYYPSHTFKTLQTHIKHFYKMSRRNENIPLPPDSPRVKVCRADRTVTAIGDTVSKCEINSSSLGGSCLPCSYARYYGTVDTELASYARSRFYYSQLHQIPSNYIIPSHQSKLEIHYWGSAKRCRCPLRGSCSLLCLEFYWLLPYRQVVVFSWTMCTRQ